MFAVDFVHVSFGHDISEINLEPLSFGDELVNKRLAVLRSVFSAVELREKSIRLVQILAAFFVFRSCHFRADHD